MGLGLDRHQSKYDVINSSRYSRIDYVIIFRMKSCIRFLCCHQLKAEAKPACVMTHRAQD